MDGRLSKKQREAILAALMRGQPAGGVEEMAAALHWAETALLYRDLLELALSGRANLRVVDGEVRFMAKPAGGEE